MLTLKVIVSINTFVLIYLKIYNRIYLNKLHILRLRCRQKKLKEESMNFLDVFKLTTQILQFKLSINYNL